MPILTNEEEELVAKANELCKGPRMPSRHQLIGSQLVRMLKGEIPFLEGESRLQIVERLKKTLEEGEYR